jgi:hypothetical protein
MDKIPRSRALELIKQKKKTKRKKIVVACSGRRVEPSLLVFSEGGDGEYGITELVGLEPLPAGSTDRGG